MSHTNLPFQISTPYFNLLEFDPTIVIIAATSLPNVIIDLVKTTGCIDRRYFKVVLPKTEGKEKYHWPTVLDKLLVQLDADLGELGYIVPDRAPNPETNPRGSLANPLHHRFSNSYEYSIVLGDLMSRIGGAGHSATYTETHVSVNIGVDQSIVYNIDATCFTFENRSIPQRHRIGYGKDSEIKDGITVKAAFMGKPLDLYIDSIVSNGMADFTYDNFALAESIYHGIISKAPFLEGIFTVFAAE